MILGKKHFLHTDSYDRCSQQPTCTQLRATALPMRVSPYPARNLSILDRSLCSTGSNAAERNRRECSGASRPLPPRLCSSSLQLRVDACIMHACGCWTRASSSGFASFTKGTPQLVFFCARTRYLSRCVFKVETPTAPRDAVGPSVSSSVTCMIQQYCCTVITGG